MSESCDHPFTPVPMSERRGPITMALLWITMVTAFPSVLVGFQWYKDGFSLLEVIGCALIGCMLLLAYAVPASQLGARTGQSFGALSRGVFGRWGSRLVNFNLIWIFVAWYGLAALFLAEGFEGLFHVHLPMAWLAAGLAVLMAFNNFFGFKGVANFARYFAAPVLIVWVGYTFFKAMGQCPPTVLMETSHKSFGLAVTTVSSFIIGFAVWGNEADYWRFSKPKTKFSLIPIAVALCIGEVIFPATGWVVARITGITDYAAATAFMNDYSFGGIAILGALVLTASYFAANDSNLFGSAQACNNIIALPHRTWVTILAILGAAMAAWLSVSGSFKALEAIASLNCIFLPTATVIVMGEWIMWTSVFKMKTPFAERIPEHHELPAVRWPALIALVAAAFVGVMTSGVVPGTEKLHVGICSLQAWLTALIVYMPLRFIEYRSELAGQRAALEDVYRLGNVQAQPVEIISD